MVHASAESHKTQDHDIIKDWAEERGGHPATVKGTDDGDAAGVLRIEFSDRDHKLEPISWDEFFEKFDKENLCFLYQENTADGHVSRFHRFVES